jgi:hypothetical protein
MANELESLNGPALLSALRLSNSGNAQIKAILISSTLSKAKNQARRTDADRMLGKDRNIGPSLRNCVVELLGLAE